MSIYGILSSYQNMRNMNYYAKSLNKNNEKLSTGRRVNKASDDPSSVLRINRLENKLRGNRVAQRNVVDGIKLLDTADSSLKTAVSIAHRIKELSVQYQNGTLSSQDKLMIEEETNTLLKEMGNVINKTEYNGRKIFNDDVLIQTGYKAGDNLLLDTKLRYGSKAQISPVEPSKSSARINAETPNIPTRRAHSRAIKAYAGEVQAMALKSEVDDDIVKHKLRILLPDTSALKGEIDLDFDILEDIFKGDRPNPKDKHYFKIYQNGIERKGSIHFSNEAQGKLELDYEINGKIEKLEGTFGFTRSLKDGYADNSGYFRLQGKHTGFASTFEISQDDFIDKPDKGIDTSGVCDAETGYITKYYDKYRLDVNLGSDLGIKEGQISLDMGYIDKILDDYVKGMPIDTSLKHDFHMELGDEFYRGEFHFETLTQGKFTIDLPINGKVKTVTGYFGTMAGIENKKLNGGGYINVSHENGGKAYMFNVKYVGSSEVKYKGYCNQGEKPEDETPLVPIEKPTVPIEKPKEEIPLVPIDKPAKPVEKPKEEMPLTPIDKPAEPTDKPEEKPNVDGSGGSDKENNVDKKPLVPIEKPVGGNDSDSKPLVPIDKPVSPGGDTCEPGDTKPVTPVERPTVPEEKPLNDDLINIEDIVNGNYNNTDIKNLLSSNTFGENEILDTLSSHLSRIGTKSNILEYRLESLRNQDITDTGAMANIRDLDMAKELMDKVRNQMLLSVNTQLFSSNLDNHRNYISQLLG